MRLQSFQVSGEYLDTLRVWSCSILGGYFDILRQFCSPCCVLVFHTSSHYLGLIRFFWVASALIWSFWLLHWLPWNLICFDCAFCGRWTSSLHWYGPLVALLKVLYTRLISDLACVIRIILIHLGLSLCLIFLLLHKITKSRVWELTGKTAVGALWTFCSSVLLFVLFPDELGIFFSQTLPIFCKICLTDANDNIYTTGALSGVKYNQPTPVCKASQVPHHGSDDS